MLLIDVSKPSGATRLLSLLGPDTSIRRAPRPEAIVEPSFESCLA